MLKEFLASAKLNGVFLGQSKAEVEGQLGTPKDRSESNAKTEVWKYDGLQIAFDKGSVSSIGLYFEDGAAVLPTTGLMHLEDKRLEDFKSFLLQNKIDFTTVESLTFEEQTCLHITESQVGIYFLRGEIYSIQVGRN